MRLSLTANDGRTQLEILTYDSATHKVDTIDPADPVANSMMRTMRDLLSQLVGDGNPTGLKTERDRQDERDGMKLHRCAHPDCPGLPYRASESPHPCGTVPLATT